VLRRVALAAVLTASAIPLQAQWLNYKTPGVPRTKTGEVDLNAPTPKQNGKPDLSGLWVAEDNRPCPAGGCLDMKVGQGGGGGRGGAKSEPWVPFQPWAAALTKERTRESRLHDPISYCLPAGPVRLHAQPLMRKIIQTPMQVTILNEHNVWYRQIFTDGRPLPVDPLPTWNGYSVAKWEGDTLVVQSNGFRDDMWLDANGSPMTSKAKITERFRRPKFGRLDVDVTVDDPGAYTRPWTVSLKQFYVPDSDLLDSICVENEKDAVHLRPPQ